MALAQVYEEIGEEEKAFDLVTQGELVFPSLISSVPHNSSTYSHEAKQRESKAIGSSGHQHYNVVDVTFARNPWSWFYF
jgi:hypothetical protein